VLLGGSGWLVAAKFVKCPKLYCTEQFENTRDGSYVLLRRPIRYNTLLIRNRRIIQKHIYAILGGTRGLAPTTLQPPRIVSPAS
jgi:hypothetical protein